MVEKATEEQVRELLGNVKHPAIDRTLIDLGIVKSIAVDGNRVEILFAFPFPNIPIKDMLINSVTEPLVQRGMEVKVETTVMSQDELQKFLDMEREAWKGGI